jgi:tripartite ATP-independent transporter DctM subunit
MLEGLLGLALFMALALLRVPLAYAMGMVGFAGFGLLVGWMPSARMVGQVAYDAGMNYTLSVIPLFVLMGNLVVRAGLSDDLYAAAHSLLGHRKGGLAMATIAACAGFGAICGSSIATAATMSKVAYPPMKRFGYKDTLSVGAIAAGGTLGILIPPSTIFVIYGMMTDTSIGKLFAAGVLPGLLAAFLLCVAVTVVVRFDPSAGPVAPRSTGREKIAALRRVWLVALLFGLVMGGLYAGLFTATEAAAVGAGGALVLTWMRGALTLRALVETLAESARTTSMLFLLLIGALVFANFVNYTSLPQDLKAWVVGLGVAPWVVIAVICAIYILLGTAMEELTMILLTVPIFFPLVTGLGFDPIWFGVIVVVVMEIGLISPPIGMNMFVLRTTLPHVPLTTTFRGVMPFLAADVVRLAILVAFPAISLFLPRLMP